MTTQTVERPAGEQAVRRIAVILGPGGGTAAFLDLLLPLLDRGQDIEMQGVFIEEADARYAAELPFVQELCRVTFNVREFTTEQFEQALALRLRTARRALEILARRAGVAHSFHNVRGSVTRLLCDTAAGADLTVFEPVRVQPGPRPGHRRNHVVAVLDRPAQAAAVLTAALRLAGGAPERVGVVLMPGSAAEQAELEREVLGHLAGRPLFVRAGAPGDTDLLAAVARNSAAGILVLPASPECSQCLPSWNSSVTLNMVEHK